MCLFTLRGRLLELNYCLNLAKAAPAKKAPVPKKTAEKKGDEKVKKAPIRSVQKAQKVQRKVVKGTHGTRVKKVRTTVQFKRPRTFRPARKPKYPRKSTPARNRYVAKNINISIEFYLNRAMLYGWGSMVRYF